MILEFSLFGFPIWSFTLMNVELEGEEYVSNAGGDFELAEEPVPYGFAFPEDEDD